MQDLFTVTFKGHPNVRATNRMTLELTREDFLTLRGDCILGILADASCRDLSNEVKAQICTDDSKLRFRIEVEGEHFEFDARGSGSLILTHPVSMVIRRSMYVCSRTLAIKSTAAACDVSRPIVTRLAAGAEGRLRACRKED